MKYAVASIKAVLCTLVKDFKISTKDGNDSVDANGILFFTGSNTTIRIDKLK